MELDFKSRPNKDVLETSAAIITVCAAIIALASSYKENKTINFWYTIPVVISLTGLVLWIILYRHKNRLRYNSSTKAFHEFNHRLRNELYELRSLYSQNKLSRQTLISNVKKTGEFSVNVLSNVMSEITGKQISTHIKTFPIDTHKPNSYRTLCICSVTEPERLTINDHLLTENTHFLNIVEGKESHFFSDNLAKTIKKYAEADREFKISTKKWQKWFKSIMVVPIRIESSLKDIRDAKDGIQYDYLGFICCDSEETGAFKIRDKEAHLNLMKSFGDGLYLYLDEIKNYLNNIN
jgi:hypothetical protein